MKLCLKILVTGLLGLATAGFGQEINPGLTFMDGQRLTAAQLGQLVSQATIQPAFYTDKIIQTNLNTTDILLVYNPISGTFHQITGNTAVFGNTAVITGQPAYGTNLLNWYDSILLYDPTNTILAQTTFTNLAQGLIPYAFTGRPAWPYSTQQTTNQPQLVVLDATNIPYTESLSNIAPNLAYNLIPYTFDQIFTPYSYLGTNAATNVWALTNIFAITNIFIGTNPVPTLTDTDSVPIYAQGQLTNTTMTLGALYSYLTNKNTLPPYTLARIQFSGVPVTLTVSNDANTAQGLIHATNNIFTAGSAYAVDFITNSSQVMWSGINTNILYYVVPQATNTAWFRVYSNYANAVAATNPITIINSGSGGLNQMLYLTNYTSFNADVIPTCSTAAHIAGGYQVCFRTPAANTLYYTTASAIQTVQATFTLSLVNIVDLPINPITTNWVKLQTGYMVFGSGNVTQADSPLVQVLINPQ